MSRQRTCRCRSWAKVASPLPSCRKRKKPQYKSTIRREPTHIGSRALHVYAVETWPMLKLPTCSTADTAAKMLVWLCSNTRTHTPIMRGQYLHLYLYLSGYTCGSAQTHTHTHTHTNHEETKSISISISISISTSISIYHYIHIAQHKHTHTHTPTNTPNMRRQYLAAVCLCTAPCIQHTPRLFYPLSPHPAHPPHHHHDTHIQTRPHSPAPFSKHYHLI